MEYEITFCTISATLWLNLVDKPRETVSVGQKVLYTQFCQISNIYVPIGSLSPDITIKLHGLIYRERGQSQGKKIQRMNKGSLINKTSNP